MSATKTKCTATGRSRGTASGWRSGCRCPKCRRAHNREVNQYRQMSAEQRAEVLHLLRAGRTVEEAAAAIGKTPGSLANAARKDSELRLALDGEPLERQHAARKGDFLAALTRNGGNRAAAAHEIGLSPDTATAWERDSTAFTAAVNAVLAWLAQDKARRPRVVVTTTMLDKAADLMEAGASMAQAAATVGLRDQGALRRNATRHPRLAALLPEVDTKKGRRAGVLSADTRARQARLRKLWAQPDMTLQQIAAELEVSHSTVYRWTRTLRLPGRKPRRVG